jgi:hypothetical protein
MSSPDDQSRPSSAEASDWMIDGPHLSATLATWERHLALLKSLPDSTFAKNLMIEAAEEQIARKKKEA